MGARRWVRYSLYARTAPSLLAPAVPRFTMMCVWNELFLQTSSVQTASLRQQSLRMPNSYDGEAGIIEARDALNSPANGVSLHADVRCLMCV